MGKTRIIIAAGGTGGHLFPAGEVRKALEKAGAEVHLITDSRGKRFAKGFTRMHTITGGQWSGEGLWRRFATLCLLAFGFLQSLFILLRVRPRAIIGMGGYISVPPVMCGWLLLRRTVIFNADSVLGNANILLSRFATKIALAFDDTVGVKDARKAVVVGLPLRDDVIKAAKKRYNPGGPIFITSGSQGTKRSDEIIPKAFSLLPANLAGNVKIYQQVMAENLSTVRAYYKKLGINAVCEPFFANGSELLGSCSLFIGRGGASTVAEVGTIGRPCILIPLEHKDRQQILNAEKITSAGGGVLLRQSELTSEGLSTVLSRLLKDTKLLEKMAKNAKVFPTNNNAGAGIARLAME